MATAVRQPLSTAAQPRRALDERFAIRFGRIAAWQARVVARLPPTSRLRMRTVARTAWLGLQAFNRRDLEAVVALCDPALEYRPERRWVEAGLVEPSYRGLDGYRRYITTVDQVWGGENRLTPREVVDLGDRLLIVADGEMRAQASGVPWAQEFALLVTLNAGRPATGQEYYDHAEAYRALDLAR